MLFGLLLTLGVAVLSVGLRTFHNSYAQKAGALGILMALWSLAAIMRTRGKRVVAEVTIPRRVLTSIMRVEPESLFYHSGVANVGSFLAGVNNNGLHSPNGITAMFIATGQDVANVAESSAGILFSELTPQRDLYMSLTMPSLIVATSCGCTPTVAKTSGSAAASATASRGAVRPPPTPTHTKASTPAARARASTSARSAVKYCGSR